MCEEEFDLEAVERLADADPVAYEPELARSLHNLSNRLTDLGHHPGALLIIEEAGGWTNNFLAKDGLVKGNPVLACTAELAEALIAATGIGKEP